VILTINKVYFGHRYSFLVVLEVSGDDADPYIFVVKDQVLVAESSSCDSSSSCEDPLEQSSSDLMAMASAASDSDSSDPEDSHPFLIYPQRVLHSIASLKDLEFYTTEPAEVNGFYRANTVALLMRSKKMMNSVLGEVIADFRENAALQNIPISAAEVVELQYDIPGLSLPSYYFR